MEDLFDFGPSRGLFAVMGNPVSHSKSPRVHSLFAEQTGISVEYQAIHVEIGGFEQAVYSFQASGGRGLNITVPFKVNAYRLSENLSIRAREAQAVNTLMFGDELFGDNTDGAGLVVDIESNIGLALKGTRILVIGAGGAVRGVLGALKDCKPSEIVIANRTKDRAAELASIFNDSTVSVVGCGLDEIPGSFHVVVNATTTSLSDRLPEVDAKVFEGVELAYDMVYKSEATSFQRWARDCGAKNAVDGLGMLIEQAAESFWVWHKIRPETKPVLDVLRKEL